MKLLEKVAKRKVEIVNYDPQWPTLYEKEKTLIQKPIGNIIVGIEHIEITAVPGSGARAKIKFEKVGTE